MNERIFSYLLIISVIIGLGGICPLVTAEDRFLDNSSLKIGNFVFINSVPESPASIPGL